MKLNFITSLLLMSISVFAADSPIVGAVQSMERCGDMIDETNLELGRLERQHRNGVSLIFAGAVSTAAGVFAVGTYGTVPPHSFVTTGTGVASAAFGLFKTQKRNKNNYEPLVIKKAQLEATRLIAMDLLDGIEGGSVHSYKANCPFESVEACEEDIRRINEELFKGILCLEGSQSLKTGSN
ncbi:MAG: hypothetical protein ACRBBP_02560 [Bdellovibrionales bacterium]